MRKKENENTKKNTEDKNDTQKNTEEISKPIKRKLTENNNIIENIQERDKNTMNNIVSR